MKRVFGIMFMLLTLSVTFTACSLPSVEGGEEMVVTQKPWIFGSSGVIDESYPSGRYWLALTTSYDIYDVKPVKYEETFTDVITYDNNPVDFSAYLVLEINKGEAHILHEQFGKKWYKNNIEDQFRKGVRNKCSQFTMFVLSTNRSIVDSLEQVLFNEMREYVQEINLPVNVKEVIIGKVTPPADVLRETTKTAAQTQAIKTQEARRLSENSRKEADISKAEADMAYMNAFRGMTINQYLTLRSLEIEKEKIDMIKGKNNVSIIMQSGSNADVTPIVRAR